MLLNQIDFQDVLQDRVLSVNLWDELVEDWHNCLSEAID